jgi:Transposase IS4
VDLATSQDPPMVAFSWLDGNPVNFLTTADGTELSEVQRRVSRQKQAVSAPACVGRYNKNMQAVDRFDQLNQLFSLAKRHKFKKYYNQLSMALLDMALVNAERHFFMVDGRKKHDESRYEFRKVLSQYFLDYTSEINELNDDFRLNNLFVSPQDVTMPIPDNVDNPGRVVLGKQQDDGFLWAPNTEAPMPSIAATTARCQPISVMAYMKQNNSNLSGGRSYRGSRCQVCAWEMRANVTKNVAFCSEHGIRMCTVLRPLPPQSPLAKALLDEEKKKMLDEWYCNDQSITCWRKGHEFYIPRGIWGKKPQLRYDSHGCPKTICAAIGCCAYKKRSEWQVIQGLKNSTPKSRGRKRKHKKLPDMELENVVETEKV